MSEILLPIDISSIIWMVAFAFFYLGMKEYVEYKTGKTIGSKPQLFEAFIKMIFGQIREGAADLLPMWKDYKSKTGNIPVVKDLLVIREGVTKLVEDMDIVKEDVIKLKISDAKKEAE